MSMILKTITTSWMTLGVISASGMGLLAACNSPTSITETAPSEPSTLVVDQDASSSMSHDMMNMDLGPNDAEFDLRFIDAMILHHEGAIAMAEDALASSTRDEITQLADAIIAAQQVEIAQMQEWRQAWYPDAAATPMMYHAEMNHMMPMSAEMKASMMMAVDLGSSDADFDLRFIDAMIPHHEGALVMAEEALEKSDRPEMQALAQDILTTQQQEIDQMIEWRQTWYEQ